MREIKFTLGIPDKEGNGWKRQYYVKTLGLTHKCQGYIMRKVQNHIYANKRGYVCEHRLIMEEKLGRFLMPRKELVHHIDGDRSNNKISNLKLTSPVEHPKGHIGERNKQGQFVANEPIFQEIKIRLLNTNTKECRAYTLSELIGKTYRKGQFKFRGRFTGLKDKNGKEIWEGDIIKNKNVLNRRNFIVRFIIDGWCLDAGETPRLHNYIVECGEVEIIGNIYENSNLLEN